jgi:hypothetical protein
LVAVVLSASAGPVLASGWSANGFFRQQFGLTLESGGDNDDLPASTTSLGVTIANQTPTTLFSISPGVVLTIADRSDNQDTFRVNPSLGAQFTHNAPRLSLSGSASVIPQFRSDRQFDSVFVEDPDTGQTLPATEIRNVDPLEIVSSGRLGANYQLTPRSSLNTSIFFRRIDYSGERGTLEPSTTVGASAGVSRTLDSRTSGSVSVTARRFMSEDEDQGDSNSVSLSVGASRQLSPRLNGRVSLGVTGVDDDDGFDTGFTGGVSGQYRFGDATVTAGLRQSVDQNDDGVVESITAANAGVSYRVNERSSLGFSAGYSRSEPFAADNATSTDALTLGARYGFRLTANWATSLSYGLRAESDNGDDADVSHRFSVSFSRNFDFLP